MRQSECLGLAHTKLQAELYLPSSIHRKVLFYLSNQIDDAPKISMGLKTSYSGYGNMNPGPGSYMPESHSAAIMRKSPEYSLRPKTAMTSSTMANPGPGAYNPSVDQAKEQGPRVGFGSAKRNRGFQGEGPGPGAYHRGDSGRPVSSGPKSPEYRFGTSSRDDFYATEAKKAPAPGQCKETQGNFGT